MPGGTLDVFFLIIQSELDRRHQSAFLKKRFCIHHVPPARAADKKNPTNIGNIKNKERIMQPESSMDPGEISIQKFKVACEMVTITKQKILLTLAQVRSVS